MKTIGINSMKIADCDRKKKQRPNINNNNNNNNFIYTPDSEVKRRSVVLTITYSKTSRVKNVNTFINYLYYSKSDHIYIYGLHR